MITCLKIYSREIDFRSCANLKTRMSAVAWNEAIDAPLNVTVRFTFSEIVSVGLGAGEWLG